MPLPFDNFQLSFPPGLSGERETGHIVMADYGRPQVVVDREGTGRLLRCSLGGAVLCILLTLGWAGAAVAYGGGYGFPGFPGSGGGGGGFRNVVAAASIPSTGGSVSGSANGATISVVVSSGSFTNTEEVVISSNSPCGFNVGGHDAALAVFGVSSLSPDSGKPNRGPVAPPLSVTVMDQTISLGDSVVPVGSGAGNRRRGGHDRKSCVHDRAASGDLCHRLPELVEDGELFSASRPTGEISCPARETLPASAEASPSTDVAESGNSWPLDSLPYPGHCGTTVSDAVS